MELDSMEVNFLYLQVDSRVVNRRFLKSTNNIFKCITHLVVAGFSSGKLGTVLMGTIQVTILLNTEIILRDCC